jgi:Ca2+-binding RTX toxin-like protein
VFRFEVTIPSLPKELSMRKILLLPVTVGALLLAAPASAAVIYGTPGDDSLTGTDRRDFIYARAGNDTASAGNGSDFVFGGRGDDTLSGDDSRDFLFGGPGKDTLQGGGGPDSAWAGRGADTLEGGAGNDALHAAADDGQVDVVDCGPGDFDRAVIRAGDVAIDCERVRSLPPGEPAPRGERIFGTPGDDTLTGTDGRDFIFGKAGNDTIDGLPGSDFLFGNAGDDSVVGGDGVDYVWGGSGNDSLATGLGNDWLWAGWGADTLAGEDGSDHLFAGVEDAAEDNLDCGAGEDRAVMQAEDVATGCEHVRVLA